VLPPGVDVHINAKVLLFAVILSICAGLFFGIAPASQIKQRSHYPRSHNQLTGHAYGSDCGSGATGIADSDCPHDARELRFLIYCSVPESERYLDAAIV